VGFFLHLNENHRLRLANAAVSLKFEVITLVAYYLPLIVSAIGIQRPHGNGIGFRKKGSPYAAFFLWNCVNDYSNQLNVSLHREDFVVYRKRLFFEQ